MINSLFRENFAETGLGRPVTSEIRKQEKKDYPLAIYDTPGFELSNEQQNNVKKEKLDIVKVVSVLAQDMDFDEEYIVRAYGLDQLIDVMA